MCRNQNFCTGFGYLLVFIPKTFLTAISFSAFFVMTPKLIIYACFWPRLAFYLESIFFNVPKSWAFCELQNKKDSEQEAWRQGNYSRGVKYQASTFIKIPLAHHAWVNFVRKYNVSFSTKKSKFKTFFKCFSILTRSLRNSFIKCSSFLSKRNAKKKRRDSFDR